MMKTLVVRQIAPNGAARTWRLRPDGKPVTLGTSRLAGLTSVDPSVHPIEGVLEFREDRWRWISLSPANVQTAPVVVLEDNTIVELPGSRLHFAFHQKEAGLLERLQSSTAAEPKPQSAPFELEIVKFMDRVLSTRVLKPGSPESAAARAARRHGGDQITVLRRPVHLGSTKDLSRLNPAQAMDREAQRGTLIVALCSVLFAAGAVFGPRTDMDLSIALPPPPQQITVAMTPTMKPKQTEKKPQPKAPSDTADAGGQKNAGRGRVAGLLKAVSGGRLSTLLGKVSAQAARSREVVVQKGVRAGDGPSGRALAALGNVDRAGGDWTGAAAGGTGVSVSTKGKGVGSGLSAGNVGQAGVGLIEDESEITGGLDRDIIAQTIKAYLGQILYCYERQLSANPELFGKVAVRFTIGSNGGVETQAIGDTTLRNATVEGCILNKVAGWKFPAPTGGTKVMVTYPFLFKSTN